MSHLQYYAYKGVGERNLKSFGYNQAVRIGDRIECSGQGMPLLPLDNLFVLEACANLDRSALLCTIIPTIDTSQVVGTPIPANTTPTSISKSSRYVKEWICPILLERVKPWLSSPR